MAQRNSGYARIEANFYPTPGWVTRALMTHAWGLDDYVRLRIWEPACGDGAMVDEFKQWGYKVFGTDLRGHHSVDFLSDDVGMPRRQCNAIITNPPYQRDVTERFIRKALALMEPVNGLVAMLLRVDFDSAVTRQDIFKDHPAWGEKLVLLKRIKWFDDGNKNGPSENHAWFVWDWRRKDEGLSPGITYGF